MWPDVPSEHVLRNWRGQVRLAACGRWQPVRLPVRLPGHLANLPVSSRPANRWPGMQEIDASAHPPGFSARRYFGICGSGTRYPLTVPYSARAATLAGGRQRQANTGCSKWATLVVRPCSASWQN